MRRVWSGREIRERLAGGDTPWLARAVVAIHDRQLAGEEGFDLADAPTGVRLGRLLARGVPLAELPALAHWARQAMPRYAERLARIANGSG